jgi:opacity protein-like surface antigen
MKKGFSAILAVIFCAGLTAVDAAASVRVGGSVNYYAVSDSNIKSIYGSGSSMVGGFLSLGLFRRIEIGAEANYFRAKGKMTLTEEEISLVLMPFVLRARYRIADFGRFGPYLGAGLAYFSYKENLPSRLGNVSETAVGELGEAGCYCQFGKRLFLDVNIRYIICETKPFDESIKLGGLRAGLGIGYIF